MVIDLNDTYRKMMTMMMILMIKIQNGHNSANFEATFSRFCMVIDLNNTYRMMMIMMYKLFNQMAKYKSTKISKYKRTKQKNRV